MGSLESPPKKKAKVPASEEEEAASQPASEEEEPGSQPASQYQVASTYSSTVQLY